MSLESITFQLATHFLSKVALRLEYLFSTIEEACEESNAIIHHAALKNIIEITQLIDKPELKSRFIKEFVRIEHIINKSQDEYYSPIYSQLFAQIQLLNQVSGRFAETILQDPFLWSLRFSQPSVTQEFELDSPQLVLWLHMDAAKRKKRLSFWLQNLKIVYDTVAIYLAIIRDTAQYEKIRLINGFYQQGMPLKKSCHLILLRMDRQVGCIPKIQIGQHGLSMRLFDGQTLREVRHTPSELDLAICQI